MKRIKPAPLVGRPRVSIVIPCYNYGRFLPEAVQSALDQPEVDIEVVIAENGSTDNSLQVARELAASDARIHVYTHPETNPMLVNFNDGLRHATGDYTVFLSADDLLSPGSLTRSAALMQSHPEVVMVYGHAPMFETSPPSTPGTVRSWAIWPGEQWVAWIYRTGRNFVLTPEALTRTSVLRAVGGFDTSVPVGADMLLWMRVAMRGSIGRINGSDQAYFRVHGENSHLSLSEGLLTDLKGRRDVLDLMLEIDPPRHQNPARLSASAHRAVALDAVRSACAAFDSGDTKLGEGYAVYAIEAWPQIVETRRWKSVRSRRAGAFPVWRREAARIYRRVRAVAGAGVHRLAGI